MEPDPDQFLAELQSRWRGANTLQYRSLALLAHAGELRLLISISVILRRPNLGRLRFDATGFPEAARVRVGDGRRLYDRQQGAIGKAGRTSILGYRNHLTENLIHPLDNVAYFPDQFFSPTPFQPDPYWGDGKLTKELKLISVTETLPIVTEVVSGDRKRVDTITAAWPKKVLRLTLTAGTSRDTFYFDPISYALLLLTRVGNHAGRVQELLREVFTQFSLGTLSGQSNPFIWTEDDERGILPPEEKKQKP